MRETVIDRLEQVVAELSEIDAHELPDCLKLEWTQRALRAQRRLDGFLTTTLQAADASDATTSECARSTRGWLVEEQLLSQADAAARVMVARSSVTRPAITEALRAGEISLDHAKLIVGFLRKLKDADAKDHAEKLLLDSAKYTDPTRLTRELRGVADRMGLDETAEERANRMYADRWLTLTDTIHQMVNITGTLDRTSATILRKALYPLAVKAGEHDDRTPKQRDADALTELARLAMNRGELPETAGEPTQITMITDLADLVRRMLAGDVCTSTMDGTPITANTARMLSCDAGIIPAVMGGASEILDLGRSTRTWSRAQRRAAKLRANGRCESPKCQATIDRCDLHHEHHWAHGGPTDLSNGIYLCSYHHWLTHHTPWSITRNKHGTVQVHKT